MNRKLAATLAVAIFLVSTSATVRPAQAHFTLGNLSGTNPYDINNFDAHVAGPIGYVWPGSGQCAYNGFPNQANSNCSPGYQSPFPNGNPPGAPSESWYQLQGNTYAPFGAILADSTGDLIFALNATCTPDLWSTPSACATQGGTRSDDGVKTSEIQTPSCSGAPGVSCLSAGLGWDGWFILIPPEFTIPGASTGDASQIVSTLSNSYERVVVTKLSPFDRFAPGWTALEISADVGINGNPFVNDYYKHQFIQFTRAGEWYYVRVNGVTAPSTAGRYFFKMALFSFFQPDFAVSHLHKGFEYGYPGVGPTLSGPCGLTCGMTENPFTWVPPQNWPVLLVKGETDPAIVTGTLRYAGYNATLYQQPIAEAGMVWAKMETRLDPYTGLTRADLCGSYAGTGCINAQGFVNATANGHYELEGLAAGVYDIYAQSAGYPQTLCETGITLLKGEWLSFDCYLQPGPVIHGNVFTKHQFGDEPWPGNSTTGQYMKIELYTNPTLSNIVDPSAGEPVSWSPLPCTAGGQEVYYGRGRAAGLCGDPRDASAIAFPWHEYSTVQGAVYGEALGNALFTGQQNGYSRDVGIGTCTTVQAIPSCTQTFPYGAGGSTFGVNNLLASDPEGVGPPQHWFVAGGTTNPFHFEFGLKGEYGAPKDLSGEVPQVYATWINGLTPGRYYVRAWTFRYVQTALDGATFQEYYFDITPNEWAGDVTLPIDLRLSSWVNKTVYFHDRQDTIETSPVHSGAGFLYGNLIGSDGNVYSNNVTVLGLLEQNTTGINPACFSGANGYIASCPFLDPASSAVHPTYYSFIITPANNNPCFVVDQRSEVFRLSNFGMFETGETGAPSQICWFGAGPAPAQEVSALDKAGLNVNSIATGEATIQFWGINDTWGGDNYGIPSGTYTPEVYVNGYAPLSSPEQVSVTLSGNPSSISDHMILGPGFNVSVYSIDWERPRLSRDWVWSGCQDDTGTIIDQNGNGCLGSEIDLGWYPVVNGTVGHIADWFGPAPALEPPAVNLANNEGGLFQGPGGTDCLTGMAPSISCAELDGGGRNVLLGYSLAHDVFYGSGSDYVYPGCYTRGLGDSVFTTASQLDVRSTNDCTSLGSSLPRHFNEGQYNLAAYTYGYIQDKDFSVYAMNGQVAHMKVNLIIGVNVTLDILFKKESIITPTPFNMSARVRLFNDQDQLVAEWMSSEGTYADRTGHAMAANGALTSASCFGTPNEPGGGLVGLGCYPAEPFQDQGGLPSTVTSSLLNGYNYLPGGTNLLHLLMAGLPQQVPLGANIAGVYFSDPIFTPSGCDFELDCYSASYGRYPFPNSGVQGAPDYTGGWTAETEFVPWYANNTGNQELASGGGQCQTDFSGTTCVNVGTFPQYYPPVIGLLMGESYHIIPGTTATSGISLTEDAALSSAFVGHTMAPNHVGPYSQEGVWQIAGTHNSGEASAIFEVDLNGFISGNVLAFTWSNEFRTLSWGTISVTGASGATWPFYTYDGIYQAFLPTGQYGFTITQPGYAPQTWSVPVSPSQTGTGQNIYLEQSNTPVPEFSGAAVVAFSALAASLYLLKRRRK